MANPGFSEDDPRVAEADALVAKYGDVSAASRASGIPDATLRRRYREAKRDPGIRAAMRAVNTEMVPKSAWLKTKPDEEGNSYSVQLVPKQEAVSLEDIRSIFEGLKPSDPVPAPEFCDDDLLTIYPIADRHNGLRAWGRETGEDYDTKIASRRLTDWMGRCIASSPASGTAVILDVGDGEHMDDATNATPKSRHVLDVDSRVFLTLETSVESLAACVEMALGKHKRVIVRILPGNHNPTLYIAVMFALAERYRNEPRVEVQKVPGEFFVHRFGECLIASHHGDKAKPERIVMFLAHDHAKEWGATRHRFLFTGHLHSHKSADIGGVMWEQLRAVTARDAYSVSHAYCAMAQLQGITLHRTRGEIQRVKVGV